MSAIDLALFEWINGIAGQFPWLDWFMEASARWTPLVMVAWLGFLWFRPGRDRRERRCLTVSALLAMLVGLGLNTLPGFFFYRPRPFAEHDVTLLVKGFPSRAFPSEHAASGAAIASALAGRSTITGILLWLLAWVMMYARIHVGLHYPGDVVAGALLGWITGVAIRENRSSLAAFTARMVDVVERLIPF